MKTNKVLMAVACALCVAVLAFALAGCGGGSASGEQAKGITVSASSELKVVPDKARIRLSVITEAKTAEECQSKNAEATNAVIEACKALGIEETSIQTSYSNLFPRYGSVTSDKAASDKAASDKANASTTTDWKITGYEMTTSFTVSDLEIDNVGATVQACVAAGANQAGGVEYYVSDYDAKYNEALAKALETAKSKAESIASATGARVGKVVNVVEGYQDTSARYATSTANDAEMLEATGDTAAVAKTMPGQVDVSAEVTVTYAIG